MCYNYRIRVLCCSRDHCTGPTTTAAGPWTRTSPQGTPWRPSTGATLASRTTPTHVAPTVTRAAGATGTGTISPPSTETTTPTTKTSPGTPGTGPTAGQGTTGCQPQCEWTDWFDVDFPTSGVEGGDMETFDNIRAAGGKLCREPKDVQCRAESYPEVSIDQIGQVISCSLQTGLVCRNADQKGQFNMCFNYNVRALCCQPSPYCPTSAATSTSSTAAGTVTSPGPGASTRAVTWSQASSPRNTPMVTVPTSQTGPSSPGTTQTLPPLSRTTQILPSSPRTTQTPPSSGTTWRVTVPTSQTVPSSPWTTQTLHPSSGTTWRTTVPTSQPGPSSPQTTQRLSVATGQTLPPSARITDRVSSPSPSSSPGIPTTTTKPTSAHAPTTVPVVTSSGWTTPWSQPSRPTSRTTPVSTASRPGSTTHTLAPSSSPGCRPRCAWTDWFDEDYPIPGPDGGDFETFAVWRLAGHVFCDRPRDIECRSEKVPDAPLEEVGQVVQCNVSFGLVCRNREQPGPLPYCHNFHVRLLCCEDYSHCANSAVPEPTTSSSSTGQRSSQVPEPQTTATYPSSSATTQRVTVPTTQTLPPSSGTTQTPPPSSGTTQTLPSSPGTTKTLSPSSGTTQTPPPSSGTTQTHFTSPGTTQSLSVSSGTTQILPSSQRTTQKVSVPTSQPGPSSPRTTQTLSPSSGTTWRTTVPTSQTGPSSPWTTQTLPPSSGTTWRTTVPTSQPGPSSPQTTQRLSVATGQTLPPSARITDRVSSPSPSSSPGIPTTTTKPTSAHAPTTVPVVTSGGRTTPWSQPSRPTSRITPVSTASRPGSTTHTLAPSSSPGCRPRCAWTDWFDEDYPIPGPDGGDFETFAVWRLAGHVFCDRPRDIECRSEKVPDAPLEEVGQVVQCNVSFGLVCRNREQPGPLAYCHNFHVRLLCCEDYSHCATTPATTAAPSPSPVTSRTSAMPTTTPTSVSRSLPSTRVSASPTWRTETSSGLPGTVPSTAGATSSTRTSLPPPTTEATSSPPSTALGSSTVASTATSPAVGSTACEPRCAWTDWLDESYPVPGASGGDFETYANIRAAGKAICKRPLDLECRAELLPDVPLQELGQVVQCRLGEGLVCHNRDQVGRFKMCLNYHIRVLCCDDYSHCPGTLATTTMTPRATSPGPTPTLAASTTVWSPTTPSPTAPSTGHTAATSPCQPACRWTGWLDSDQPLPGRFGGDIETYYHIQDTGGQLCADPEAIECQAVLFPDVPLEQLGQVLRCDVNYGLICRNNRQRRGQTCLNYHIRVLCCDDYSHCASSAVPEPTSSSSSTGQRSSQVPGPRTTATHPSSPATTRRVTVPTTQTVPPSSVTSQTLPSSPGTTQTLFTSPGTIQTPPPSSGTTQTLPSSPETTQTLPSSPGTTQTLFTSLGTTQSLSVSSGTTQITPSSQRTTQRVSVPTSQPGPSSPRTTQTLSPSSGTTWRTTVPTSQTGPSSPWTTQTLPPSSGTTWRTTVPTSQPGPSSPQTTQRLSVATGQTLPPSARITDRVSSPSPSSSPGIPTTTTKPTSAHAPTTVPVVTSGGRTTPWSQPSRPTSRITPVSTASRPGSTTHTLAPSSSPGCRPRCAWTDWFDEDYPIPGPDGGDFETFAVWRLAGHVFCDRPRDIECRSEKVPDAPLEEVGQVVQCNVSFGLVCRNREQPGPLPYCHNFHVRLLCCEDYSHCATTPATTAAPSPSPVTSRTSAMPTTTPTSVSRSLPSTRVSASPTWRTETSSGLPGTVPSTAGATSSTRTSLPPPTTEATSSPPSTALGSSTVASTATSPAVGSTACEPRCAWTDWLDESYPVPGASGGDFETYANIRAAGKAICKRPLDLECRAELLPDVPLQELGQVVQCRLGEGLVCHNRDQVGRFKMCLNYHIRVLCCDDYSHCPGTLATTTMTPRATSPGPTPTLAASTTVWSPTTPSPTAPSTGHTAATSPCQPACRWTGWLDSDQPLPGRFGGDIETYYHIQDTGGQLCADPEAIECQAVLFPDVPLEQLGQVLRCDVNYGLICRNNRQRRGQTCLNYHIRVLCCDDYSHCASSAVPEPTSSSSSTGQRSSQVPGPRTTATHPSSPATTRRVTVPTTQTVPPSSVTSQTLPSSPGTTQTLFTSPGTIQTPPPSSGTTQTLPSSPETTQTLPSSPGTTQTLFTSLGTTQSLSVSSGTTQITPSSQRTTQRVSVPTSQPGPSSPRTTQTLSPSSGTTWRTTVPTSQTGPSSPWTTQTLPPSSGTTWRTTVPTSQPGPSSPQTTQRLSVATGQTLPPSARITDRVSSPSPSSSPGIPTTTTKPTSAHAPTTVPVVTSGGRTTPWSQPSRPTSRITPVSTASRPGSTTHTLAPSSSPGCRPRCAWTDWFDEDYPIPGPDGGDFETFAVWRLAGHVFCDRPRDIECRSEKVPDAPLEEVGQVVQCNVSFGLVCRNREQPGPLAYCHNFHVRLLCCEDYSHCATTPATTAAPSPSPVTSRTSAMPTTTPTSVSRSLPSTRVSASPTWRTETSSGLPGTVPSTAGATSSTRTSLPPPTTEATSSPPSTALGSSTVASTATSPAVGSTACEPRCAWTDWLDESYPVPGASGGDFETYANIRAAGKAICKRPLDLECRAELLPDVPLQELGQVVQCRLGEGLVCHNRDQVGRFKMCLNYHIRVLCCDDYSHCPGTLATTTMTPRATSPGPTPTLAASTTVWSPTTPSPTAPSTGHTAATSPCQPACRWTGWLDSDQPLPGRFGGDIETYYHIQDTGGQLCADPEAIECQAVLFPDVPLEQLGQVLRCDVNYGLICRNNRQRRGQTCLNYHIRVLCCDDYSHCASSAVPEPTSSSSSTGQRSSQVPGPRTTATHPSSPATTRRVTVPTTQTVPPSSVTTQTLPSSPGTTQTLFTSPGTIQTPPPSSGTTQTLPSSPETTQTLPSSPGTTQTLPSFPGTTQSLSVSSGTTQTLPSSPETTQTLFTSPGTTQTLPSSSGTTQTLPSSPGTTQTLFTSPGTTQTLSSSSGTTHTLPSSPGTTQTLFTSPGTTQTLPSSSGTTQTLPSFPGTTQTPPPSSGTTQTLPSSSGTTQTLPSSPGTTQTLFTFPGTTQTLSSSSGTTHTLPSSPGTTQTLFTSPGTTQTLPSSSGTTQTLPSSPGTTQTPPPSSGTTQTLPSFPGTTESLFTSPGTTQSLSVSSGTTQTLPSSPGTTQTLFTSPGTTQTLPSSSGTTKSLPPSSGTTQTPPPSSGTTQTLPSSPGTAQTLFTSPGTTQTPPPSSGTAQTPAPFSGTTQTLPSSPGTTQTLFTSPGTTQTLPSSPGTTQTLFTSPGTTQTLPSSSGTTQTLPSSPGTTKTLPPSSGTTQTPPPSSGTTQTLPSSLGTTQTLPSSRGTTQTLFTSPGTTQSLSVSSGTTQILPSSQRTTQRVSVPTSQPGPSSLRTTQTLPPSSGTTQIFPSSPRTTQAPPSSGTTWRTTVPTSQPGPSSPQTTQRLSVATGQTLPPSARITDRVSSPSPSSSPGIPTTTSKPTSAHAPTTVPVVTSGGRTTPWSQPSRPTSRITPVSTASRPGSTTHTLAPSSSPGCRPRCAWTDWFDEDYPIPGPDGGDFETFAVWRLAGHVFCDRPRDIECRSEKVPDAPLEEVGQVVQCNVSFGLVCRNREQPGPLAYCHNFHVRLLCCDDYSHCATTPATTAAPSPSPVTSRTSAMPTTTPTTVSRSLPSTRVSASPTWRTETSSGLPGTVPSTAGATSSTRTSLPPPMTEATSSPLSTAPGPSPAASTSLPVMVWTSSTSVVTTPRPPASSSTHFTTGCLCQAYGQLFSPGDVVYNKTDSAGCHFSAICNQRCEIDRFQSTCPTSSPPASSAPLSPSSAAPPCDLLVPPRQVNESWTLPDCTVARCEGNNRMVLLERKSAASVSCVNGHRPVRVWQGSEPCDFRFECECLCSGWGNSHYNTFDGTSYSFVDNCTHVLMREIRPRHGNLSIYMHNYYCGATSATAQCPRALSTRYKSTEVILTTSTGANGQEEPLILFDRKQVSPGFAKNGVSVSVTGTTTMGIDIPALEVSISFDGHVFQVRLPYTRFSHNTEGQCGTCTNSQTDDCRQPDGTTAPTCQDMAHTWLVRESSREDCGAPTPQPPVPPATPTSSPCPPAPLCELLLSPVFAECHGLIPPGPFFSSCVSDGCQADRQAPCMSLEAYAALCRAQGVCSSWRDATGGLCNFTCPSGKVYQPCGPAQPASCDSRRQSEVGKGLAEGCFCPDGHTLFNTHTNVCVRECGCVGPDGFPKSPGERWVSNCQDCVCHEGSLSVRCTPVLCEAQDRPLQCSRAGLVTVTRPVADKPCCLETLCVCNTTTCPQSPPKCVPGEELVATQEEGDCCPTFSCRPKLCTYNGTAYGIGATFPAVTPCHTCTCLSVDTQQPTVQCEEDNCSTTCPQGFQYQKVDGQCCGECVQTACLTPDGRLVQPNETWVNSLVDNCTEYRCDAKNGLHVLTPRPLPCPDPSSCKGILRKTGCCYSCEEVDSCQVRVNRTVLRHQGCATQAPVNVTFCEGSCPGVSKFSMEAQAMQRQCTCCQETRLHEEVVTMQCPDGTAVQHTYTHVDECSCAASCVPAPEAPEDSTPIFSI
uniref:Uncharacterized protein n=2 Tax=Felis catus TaxID=9685 RepID=A0ABI7W6N0_FELCA